MLDADAMRRDFPVFERSPGLVYLDSACTSLKPRAVIDAVTEYYEAYPVCGDRSLHRLGHEVTHRVDAARKRLAAFVGAPEPETVVFTKNATEGLNLVAHGFPWKRGDVVVTTDKEHNSNRLPWLRLRETHGVLVRTIPSTPEGRFDPHAMERVLDAAGDRLRLVAVVHVSNADGVALPIEDVAAAAHARGARVLVDAAQSAPHRPLDLGRLGVDYLALSAHKMLGPSGLGALVGTREALEELGPFQLGGGTVKSGTLDGYDWHDLPHRFEAGLQNYASLCALPAALDYLDRVGLDRVAAHERALNARATERLAEVPGVTVHGPPAPERAGILPFTVDGLGPHDVALYLDEAADVAVRSGAHCVHSYFAARGLDGWARASFYLYNTLADVDRFADAVATLAKGIKAPAH